MKRNLLLLTLCSLLLSCMAQPLPNEKQLRDDIGQMLLVGFRGTTIDSLSSIARDIKTYHIGGVILFEYDAPSGKHHRNISSPRQLRSLCRQLQRMSPTPLWIGIDQEGGRVTRMKPEDGFPAIPSAETMAIGGDDSVRHYARLTAEMLNAAGINLNFAPCSDVNINPKCPVIGKLGRSFSSNPQMVSHYCHIWMEEQSDNGIVSCMKHFPGHGSAAGDTHAGLVDITDSWKEDEELMPYQKLLNDNSVKMVMLAHVINRHIDSTLPCSLSKACIQHLLRETLGYNGIIITDDMAMGAIVDHYGYEEAIALAISAGADILCLSNNGKTYDPDIVPKTVDIILQLVRDKRIDANSIHQSAERIRKSKQELERNKSTQMRTKFMR